MSATGDVVDHRAVARWPSHADLVGLLAASDWPSATPRPELIVYGDFNCPYSLLASQRVDMLARTGLVVEWRAVEHDPSLPIGGRPSGPDGHGQRRELVEVAALAEPGEGVPARPPLMISNTAAAVSVYAAALPRDRAVVRRCLFTAIWTQDRCLGRLAQVRWVLDEHHSWRADTGSGLVQRWRADWLALPRPLVPAVVRPGDGTVVVGVDALAYLAGLLRGTAHHPRSA